MAYVREHIPCLQTYGYDSADNGLRHVLLEIYRNVDIVLMTEVDKKKEFVLCLDFYFWLKMPTLKKRCSVTKEVKVFRAHVNPFSDIPQRWCVDISALLVFRAFDLMMNAALNLNAVPSVRDT